MTTHELCLQLMQGLKDLALGNLYNVKCYYVTEEDTSYIIVKQSFKHNHSAVNNSVLDIIHSNYVFLNYLLISLYGILLFSSFTDDAYMLSIKKIIH